MRLLQSIILAIGLMGLVACGGSDKGGDTTPAAAPTEEAQPCEAAGDMDEAAPAEGENPCGAAEEGAEEAPAEEGAEEGAE